jgi:hypothetical protein
MNVRSRRDTKSNLYFRIFTAKIALERDQPGPWLTPLLYAAPSEHGICG